MDGDSGRLVIMAIHSQLAVVEVGAEVFVVPQSLTWRVIGRHRTCHTIHQRSHYFTGEDIIRRLMRAMVELRQLHRYPFKGSKHLKGFV